MIDYIDLFLKKARQFLGYPARKKKRTKKDKRS
jgi:hypothetical protein